MAADRLGPLLTGLRDLIVAGRLHPGEKLPARTELEVRFSVSSVTMQRAMDILLAEGFVEAHGRQGTVIAQYPPHLFHYGVVFPNRSQPNRPWLRSWTCLSEAVNQIFGQKPNRLSILFLDEIQASQERYRVFLDDLRCHRFAGLILSSMPVPTIMEEQIVNSLTPLPCAAYGDALSEIAGLGKKSHDPRSRCLDYLAKQGHRRIGVLTYFCLLEQPEERQQLLDQMAIRGLHTESRWLHGVLPEAPRSAQNLAELMFSTPDHPDALLLGDDNAVAEVIAGIRAAGRRIPDDVELAVCGNFPWTEDYAAPVKRFGVNMLQFVQGAKAFIDARRRGEPPNTIIAMDAFTDDDFPQS